MFFDVQVLIKYFLEGLAVALAAFFIPQKKMDVTEILIIALTAAAVLSILDNFSPTIATGVRQGSGFGIGLNQVGWNLAGGYADQNKKIKCTCTVDKNDFCGPSPVPPTQNEEEERPTGDNASDKDSVGSNDKLSGGYADPQEPGLYTDGTEPKEGFDNNQSNDSVEPFSGFRLNF